MTESRSTEAESLREAAAAEERAAIIAIIERYARQLSHGHGATGVGVLEQLLDEVQRRGSVAPGG